MIRRHAPMERFEICSLAKRIHETPADIQKIFFTGFYSNTTIFDLIYLDATQTLPGYHEFTCVD
jgi:hypothetical protein